MAVIVYSLSSLPGAEPSGVVERLELEQLELEPTVGCCGIGNGWG